MILKSLFVAIALALAASLAAAGRAGTSATDAGATLTARSTNYGSILFDGRGHALYAFTRDTARKSRCSGACAAAWPPYILRGNPRAGPGTKRSLLGTTRRSDGSTQVTYAGRPLYYYVGDRKAGDVKCQNVLEFGGLWLVVRASGKLVRSG